jgi:hypothetical protein
MNVGRLFREGFIAGVIGAAAVAAWFFVVDLVAGTAFLTPSVLGQAVFCGLRDTTGVEVTFPSVIAYTAVHVLAFGVVGIAGAALAFMVDKWPTTLFFVVVFFAIFEVGFYVMVALVARPLLGVLAWSNVAIGNAIAAVGMGYYLWKAHPHIAEALHEHPLGETMDGE